jgi:hypothetical protein
MAFTLPTGITHGSESRTSTTQLHPRVDEQYNNYNSRNNRRNHHYNLWSSVKQMVWGQHNPFISQLWRYSRQRFDFQYDNSWFRLLARGSNESSESGNRTHRDRKNYRNGLYYCLLVSLLSVAPVKAEGETNNTSNPVAAATGNVTNQAVQFQNNGAPSRQHYGSGVSCNGATMTFSPFYMGNHTVPFDEEMLQRSYTVAENWGGQINFMFPLDRKGLARCRSIAARQEEKMRLDYELTRMLRCAELQRKGFMLAEGTRVYTMCNDVVPIVEYKTQKKAAVKQYLKETCTPKKGIKLPWQKQEYECPKQSTEK